jgi:hypothetical protein
MISSVFILTLLRQYWLSRITSLMQFWEIENSYYDSRRISASIGGLKMHHSQYQSSFGVHDKKLRNYCTDSTLGTVILCQNVSVCVSFYILRKQNK